MPAARVTSNYFKETRDIVARSAPPTETASMPTDDRQFFIHRGQRIAELRTAQGFTQQQFADTLGIAQQTLAHYEGWRIPAPASMLTTLARTLGVGVEDLIGALPKPRQRA